MYDFEALDDYFHKINKPKKEWVKLTDDEIEGIWKFTRGINNGLGAALQNQPFYHLIRFAELSLKEKNT